MDRQDQHYLLFSLWGIKHGAIFYKKNTLELLFMYATYYKLFDAKLF